MAKPEPSKTAFGVGLFAIVASIYLAAYSVVRWQQVLIYDVKYEAGRDGVWRSGYGVTENPYSDDTDPWQETLGKPARIAFLPLCKAEDFVRSIGANQEQHESKVSLFVIRISSFLRH